MTPAFMKKMISTVYLLFYFLHQPYPQQARQQMQLGPMYVKQQIQFCLKNLKKYQQHFQTIEENGSTILPASLFKT